MIITFWEALSNPLVLTLMALLFTLSWVMQRIINRLAIMCQSIHVIHVPWGILWVTVFAYLFGFLSYKQTVILALLYLAAYPGMWYANYRFTQMLREIFRNKQITRETTGMTIWVEEIPWMFRIRWAIKTWWARINRRTLDEKIIDHILSNSSRNGYCNRHPVEAITRND